MLTEEQRAALAALPHGVWSGTPDEWDEYLFAAGIAFAQTWRGMESAPQTNGEPLLVQTLSGVPMLVTRDDACWYDWHTNRQLDEAHFTGWLPLPPTEAK